MIFSVDVLFLTQGKGYVVIIQRLIVICRKAACGIRITTRMPNLFFPTSRSIGMKPRIVPL